MKKINFAETVEEGVALVGLTAHLYEGLEKLGSATLLKQGKRAADLHVDLIHEWQGQVAGRTSSEGLFGLFRRCREIINPVQSALQNLVNTPAGMQPITVEGVSADQLLRAIIRAKENWAYIDAHPQIIIRH